MADTGLKIRITGDLEGLKGKLKELHGGFDNLAAAGKQAGQQTSAGFNSAERASRSLTEQLQRGVQATRAQGDAARDAARAASRAADEAASAERRRQREQQQAARAAEKEAANAARKRQQEIERLARVEQQNADKLRRQERARTAQVAPQITDIATQLAGGSNPLLVLLQQGGQLRDIYGSVGKAIAGTGKALLGLINPVTLAIAGVGALAFAYLKGQDEALKFNRTLITTGNVSGKTAEQLTALAQSLDNLDGVTQSGASKTINEIVSSGRIAGDQIAMVARAAEQLRSSTGKAIGETIAEFAQINDDPVAAVDNLNRKYGFLTGAIRDQIKTLQEQGRTQDAARLGVQAYADAVEQRTPNVIENLGYIERSWRGVKKAAAETLDALKASGRDTTGNELVALLKAERDGIQKELQQGVSLDVFGEGRSVGPEQQRALQNRIEQINARIAMLSGIQAAAEKKASQDESRARALRIVGDLETEARQYETAEQKRERLRIAITNRSNAAIADARIASDAQAEQSVAAARERLLHALDIEAAKSSAAVAGVKAGLVKDTVDRAIDELGRLYAAGKTQQKEFFAEKQRLETQAIDASIRAAQADLAAANSVEERAKAEAQLITLRRDRADVAKRIGIEEAKEVAALAGITADVTEDEVSRSLVELDRLFSQGKVKIQDFFAEKQRLETASVDASLKAAELERDAATTVQERAKAESEMLVLQRERLSIASRTAAEQAESERELAKALKSVKAELTGNAFAQRAVELEQARDDMLKKFGNDPRIGDFVNRLFDVRLARERLADIQRRADEVVQKMQQAEQTSAARVQAGADPAAASQEQRAARELAIQQLQKIRGELLLLPADTKGAEEALLSMDQTLAGLAARNLTGFSRALADIRMQLQQLTEDLAGNSLNAATGAFSNFFNNLITGAKSVGGALKQLATDFTASMARIASELLARQAVLSIFKGLGASAAIGVKHGGGRVGQGVKRMVPLGAASAMFALAPRFHEGGIAGLRPGEVPAILKEGERVLTPSQFAAKDRGSRGGNTINVNVRNDGQKFSRTTGLQMASATARGISLAASRS